MALLSESNITALLYVTYSMLLRVVEILQQVVNFMTDKFRL